MIKILMVVPSLSKIYGGPSKSVIELVEAISAKRISVDIVTTSINGDEQLDVTCNTWIESKNYRVRYFLYSHLSQFAFSASLTAWLFKHVCEYDIVHTNGMFSYPVLPAYWACQFHKIPYVITPHGMLEPWALAYKAWKKNLYFNLLEKPALKKASTIQMLASTEAERIEHFNLPTSLAIVPNGIHKKDFVSLPDSEIFYQQYPHTRNKNLILFLGRIDPKKGLDLLANAYGKVFTQFPQSHLIVAGQDNIGFMSTAKNYFSQAGCAEAVTFTGMLKGEQKYAALAAADIYVAPSYSEGFSISVLEGMACALPCVITTGCNFPEAQKENAAYVVDIDAEAIANALIKCLENPQKAKEMGDRAKKLIQEHYTWDKIALKMIDVYQKILDERSQFKT